MKKKKISPEFEFFVNTQLDKYKGKYIAIVGNKVVSTGNNAKDVWEKALKKHPKSIPTLAKLPKEEVLILRWK